MQIRRIDKARDFMALSPLWSKLTCESGQLSPFLSYDWFWCCWHGVWPRCRPEILVIEDAGIPVSIVPLMHWRERLSGLPMRCLGFLEYPAAPMVDLLTITEHDQVLKTLLDHLASRADWDVICFQKLPATSPTAKALELNLADHLSWRYADSLFSPYLTIEGSWESFYSASSQTVKTIQEQAQDQLQRAGEISIEEHRLVDPTSPFFQDVLELMCRSSIIDGVASNAPSPRLREFFSELTRRASKNGWLSLWLLRLNGYAIAMEYQLRSDDKVQALHAHNDPAFRHLFPGHVLTLAILQALFEDGGLHEYSSKPAFISDPPWWATVAHEMVHLKLYRPSAYARLLHRLETVVMLVAKK
ncbi:MAG: GNAT family N-acetyltransferase [Candidatus Entotheonellia bacterium]